MMNEEQFYLVQLDDVIDHISHYTVCNHEEVGRLIQNLDVKYIVVNVELLDGCYVKNYTEFVSRKGTTDNPVRGI